MYSKCYSLLLNKVLVYFLGSKICSPVVKLCESTLIMVQFSVQMSFFSRMFSQICNFYNLCQCVFIGKQEFKIHCFPSNYFAGSAQGLILRFVRISLVILVILVEVVVVVQLYYKQQQYLAGVLGNRCSSPTYYQYQLVLVVRRFGKKRTNKIASQVTSFSHYLVI